MPIPEDIKSAKPTDLGACEVRQINGRYYVYSYTSVWDSQKKRPKKVTGPCLGKITKEDGFIRSKKYFVKPQSVTVREYGIYQLFVQLGTPVFERLKEHVPSIYREVFVIALLRLTHSCTNSNMKRIFDTSIMKQLHPDLRLAPNTLSKFMHELGGMRDQMVGFMRSNVPEGTTLLFDGTNIFTNSTLSSYAKAGYNHSRKKYSQINLLYLFSSDSKAPLYYRMLPGNIVDKSSLVNAIQESGAQDCIIIGDKGFYSKANTSFLDEHGLSYILPLRNDTKYIDEAFAANLDRRKFDGCLLYHNRAVWYKKQPVGSKGHLLYIFQDDSMKQKQENLYLQKVKGEYDRYTQDAFFEKTRMGLISFISNLDCKPEDIYLKYKSRWEIEECFDYLKHSVSIGAVYQRSNESMEAWAFLNHISLLLFYSLINKLHASGLSEKYNSQHIMDICRNVYQVKLDDDQELISEISKRDAEILEKIGVTFPNT